MVQTELLENVGKRKQEHFVSWCILNDVHLMSSLYNTHKDCCCDTVRCPSFIHRHLLFSPKYSCFFGLFLFVFNFPLSPRQ